MNNKNILRIAFPFIIIFVISAIIAGYTYIQKYLSSAEAGEEALSVTLVNTRDPHATNETWEWKMVSSADRAPDPPIQLTYVANWCLQQDENSPCVQGVSKDFFYQIGTGTISINTRETAAKVTHQSVNCGRVELEIQRDGQTIATSTRSTETQCSGDLSGSVSEYVSSPAQITALINQLLNILLGIWNDDKDTGDDENPVGTVPEEPGTPGGGGSTPGNQICKARGDSCEEPYREVCGEGAEAGTRVCYKRGVCAAPGSGVQCSWGPDSFCDPCKPGTKISDPVPPMKPPQNPPANPGNPGGGNPEPMPLPADADAQKAVKLSDFLYRQCIVSNVNGVVTQYNVDACTGGNIGTNNDGQAKAEVSYSAHNIGASQTRNGKVIGYNHLQCVGFVEGAVAAASGKDYSGPTGNAQARCKTGGNYHCVRVGNNFSRVSQEPPKPNDIAVWEVSKPWAPYGHVAYVVSTTADSITVVEANNSCIGCVSRSTYTISREIANHNLAGFLRRN